MRNKIKEIRHLKKMSQEELANKAGISRATLSNLENNIEKATSTKTLIKIAAALGVSVDQIFFTKHV